MIIEPGFYETSPISKFCLPDPTEHSHLSDCILPLKASENDSHTYEIPNIDQDKMKHKFLTNIDILVYFSYTLTLFREICYIEVF